MTYVQRGYTALKFNGQKNFLISHLWKGVRFKDNLQTRHHSVTSTHTSDQGFHTSTQRLSAAANCDVFRCINRCDNSNRVYNVINNKCDTDFCECGSIELSHNIRIHTTTPVKAVTLESEVKKYSFDI